MSDWRDNYADQNLRMAQKMLEQQGEINCLTAEVERLTAKVAEYEGDDQHVIEFRDDGWTIMHPIACRPDLFGCVLNRVASGDITGPPEEGLGRYYCDLVNGALVLGARESDVKESTSMTDTREVTP